jgi:hypothetical protein
MEQYEISIGLKEAKPKRADIPAPKPIETPTVVTVDVEPVGPDFSDIEALVADTPEAEPLAPLQKYAPNPRGIKTLNLLAMDVQGAFPNAKVNIDASTQKDGLPIVTGRYNVSLKIVGVPQQRLANALKALLNDTQGS